MAKKKASLFDSLKETVLEFFLGEKPEPEKPVERKIVKKKAPKKKVSKKKVVKKKKPKKKKENEEKPKEKPPEPKKPRLAQMPEPWSKVTTYKKVDRNSYYRF